MNRLRCIFFVWAGLCSYSASVLWAAAPEISDPESKAEGAAMPGTFPTTVTAANVNASLASGSVLNGAGSNDLKVSFPAAGPIKWTDSRHNEGDISLLIGPFDPDDASYFPPNAFGEYKPLDGQPFANSTLAWRLNQQTGASLATVRHNGVDNGDTYNGSPVGTIHGIAYFNSAGSGWGYRMNDGVFANGGNSSLDLQLGIAGFDDNNGEAVFNTATAYFPYEEGWLGAWVQGADDGEAAYQASSADLPTSAVNWTGGIATVSLPGVNSASDGMLFVAPTHDGNTSNVAAAFPTGGGWSVAVREDEFADDGSTTLGGSDNGFQFLYVPYTASNLIGGHIEGSDGSSITSAGDSRFEVSRNAAGEYAVSIFDTDGQTKLTENDGMLILSVAGSLPANSTLADRTFLSYEYDGLDSGDFIVQSREVAAINDPGSENQFGDLLSLRDSDFYFAWVDFDNPLTVAAPGIPGDFDGDGDVDGDDLGDWQTAYSVDNGGDADGDGDSDGADFLIWQRNHTEAPPLTATQAVPEPGTASLVLLGAAILVAMTKRGA